MNMHKRFGERIREGREKMGLTQQQLADLLAMSRRRLGYLEVGRQQPREEEIQQFAQTLGAPRAELARCASSPEREDRAASKQVRRRHRERRLYLPQRDPEMWRRFRAGCQKYRATMDALRARLSSRPDLPMVLVWLGLLFLDSALELVAILWLLVVGARPIFASPHALGFDRQPVVHWKKFFLIGHRRMHCLLLVVDGLELILFPQVALGANGAAPRLDFLVAAARRPGRMPWFGVELDGAGHDPTTNDWKDTVVKVPIVRFTEQAVLDGSFISKIADAADERLRGARTLAA